MTSIWTFAGVLTLPSGLLAPLVVVLYLHMGWRSWRGLRRAPAWRIACSAALASLACLSGRQVFLAFPHHDLAAAGHHAVPLAIAVAATMASYFVIGILLAIPGLEFATTTWRSVIGSWSDNALELCTLCLGAFVGVAVVLAWPLAALAILPALQLQRGALVSQLETVATTDHKTGVLTVAHWQQCVERELVRAGSPRRANSCGVLMLDIDHFKAVNDTHGHLVGDLVLRAVATAITGELRSRDLVARFGGEEFVAFLADVDAVAVSRICERIRAMVSRLVVEDMTGDPSGSRVDRITVSIGAVLAQPGDRRSLDELVRIADKSLYEAKDAGRNRVVLAAGRRSGLTDAA